MSVRVPRLSPYTENDAIYLGSFVNSGACLFEAVHPALAHLCACRCVCVCMCVCVHGHLVVEEGEGLLIANS